MKIQTLGGAVLVLFIGIIIGSSARSVVAAVQFSINPADSLTTICKQINATPTPTPVSTPPVVVTPPPSPTPVPAVTGNELRFVAYNTLYASGDNTPAGSTQIDLGGHTGNAGGTGTFNDPITLAVGGSLINGKEVDDYAYGTKFYIPAFRKYFVAADFCGDGATPQNEPCHKSEEPGKPQLDLYAGNASGSAVLACEDKLTGDHLMIQNPASNYAVVTSPIFNGSCATTYGDMVVSQ